MSTDTIFSRLYACCCAVFLAGLYIDGWSHQYAFETIDTFFNPWHAVLYGGYAATAITVIVWTFLRKNRGHTWHQAIPAGHLLSLVGASFFFYGGVADMLWHEVFGFEKEIEGLISPSHLLLATGMTLMLSGGMRHWFALHRRDEQPELWRSLPLLVSMLCVLAQWTFLTQYGRYTDFTATGNSPGEPVMILCTQSISILGILLFSVMLSGLFVFVLRRASLPFGAVTLILMFQILLLGLMRYGSELIVAALIAGLVGDVLLQQWPARACPRTPLIFSFLVPAVFYAATFSILHAEAGLWWSLHLWSGIPFLAGGAGLFAGILGSSKSE